MPETKKPLGLEDLDMEEGSPDEEAAESPEEEAAEHEDGEGEEGGEHADALAKIPDEELLAEVKKRGLDKDLEGDDHAEHDDMSGTGY